MYDPEKPLEDQTRELVLKALQGDEEAISALYRLYEQPLIAVIRGRLGLKLRGQMESQDLVQSIWKDVLGDMQNFKYKNARSFFNWIVTRLIHKISMKGRYYHAGKRDIDKLKRIRDDDSHPEGVPLPPSTDPTPSHVASNHEELDHLIRLLGRFPETQRLIMIYRMRDNLSYEEIGRKLSRSNDAVRKMYKRSIEKLYGYYLD